jgi:hypothetical protein
MGRQSHAVREAVKAVEATAKEIGAAPPVFKAPEVTPAMKARFEKVETQQIKEALARENQRVEAIFAKPVESENPNPEDDVYASDNTLIPFGKNKGKTFVEAGIEEVKKSLWGANKGIQENSDWVGKVGMDNVVMFAKQAQAWLGKK